jgi:hypothetical protein
MSHGQLSGRSWQLVSCRLPAWGYPLMLPMRYYGDIVKRMTSSTRENTPTSLPVLTLGSPPQVLSSRTYAERVVVRLLEILLDLDQYRGTGRLYLP